MTAAGGRLFFLVEDAPGPYMLWRSDGTAGGTVKLGDFECHPPPGSLTDVEGKLYFAAGPPAQQVLRTSDGTVDGAVQVPTAEWVFNPAGLTAIGGVVYFSARTPGADSEGTELWRSDGTAEGTYQVADIAPGPDGSAPQNLTAIDGALYFTADDGNHGRELWVLCP